MAIICNSFTIVKRVCNEMSLQQPRTESNGRTLCMLLQPFRKPNVLNDSSSSNSNEMYQFLDSFV